ncbi:MAG: Flp pilus assembly complex ATPase component TadA [Verrucomicrobiales bacterium]|nr:Flp pilus assembly complex ATPase component TadA [Verrucomicrobiales bacterium]
MAAKDDYLIDTMLEAGLLAPELVEEGRIEAEAAGEGVLDTLVKRGTLDPSIVTMAKATYFGVESVNLGDLRISDESIALIPRHVAKKFNAIPVGQSDSGAVIVALSDPSDIDTVDGLRHAINRDVELRVTSSGDIEAALNKFYGGAGRDDGGIAKMIQDITEGEVEVTGLKGDVGEDTEEVDADAPIIRLVSQVIVDAFKKRASDIHLEPLAKRFRLRFRIDGVCVEQPDLPKRLQAPILARLKIQSGMSIAERRIPQDGRINTNVGGKTIDLRVNSIPTQHGESICMRILDKSGLKLGLAELGFFADDQGTFERLIGLPDGILLVTGPTGSGKTTTLYSCLNYINRPDRKIITVEDPVEYMLAGINQVQVHEHIGFTFAAALRSMLRQSPNVIMLGEIRDMETATIAINASLTGHLVFSTLHTNDAPSAVTRLIDIGVKPFLVASSARCFMAQRLVRKVCKNCGAPHELPEKEAKVLGITAEQLAQATPRKGKGCSDCNKTGCRGRFGIFEIFVVNDEVRRLIFDKVPANVLRKKALELGMRSLREDGTRKVLAGLTTVDEVVRATVSEH